jgi:CRP/FNR family cyclic AMP-dependent transcriptional regulator
MAKWRWLDHLTDHDQLRRLHLLERVPLFAGLSRRQLGKLLIKFFEKEYGAGETIFMQGDAGKALFVVVSGTVSIYRVGHEAEEALATLTPGNYFGELALIDDHPRFAGARAAEPSTLMILYKSDFDHLIEGHSTIAITVMGNLLKTLAGYVRKAQPQGNSRKDVTVEPVAQKGKSIGSSEKTPGD